MIFHLKSKLDLIVAGEQIIKVKHRSGKETFSPSNGKMCYNWSLVELVAFTARVLLINAIFTF